MAMDVVFGVEKSRGMLRGLVLDFFMVLLAGFFLQASLVLTFLMTFFQNYRFLSFLELGPIVKFLLRYLQPMFLTFSMSLLIYKIIPDKKSPWKRALQAAQFFSAMWEISKHLFCNVYFIPGKIQVFDALWVPEYPGHVCFLAYYSSCMFLLGGEIAHLLGERVRKGAS
jgi:uncharacterized BrkB/YihY/UPF0761 family membrane protein